jgi:hypothetical protein
VPGIKAIGVLARWGCGKPILALAAGAITQAAPWLESAYPGASTSYVPLVAFQRNWIADGVGALGQESQPSMSNVRLCVRLKGTGVAVDWGGGVGVGIGDGADADGRAPPVGPAFSGVAAAGGKG